jgi:CRISPR-associated protein Csm3
MITQKPLLGKFRITSTLLVETGLHIGGGSENLDIGGLDKPVIRDPLTRHPYLPGSSIKGKLRSILERYHNKPLNRPGGSNTYRYESDDLVAGYTEISGQLIHYEGARTCPICRVFGSSGGDKCWIKLSEALEEGLKDKSSEVKKSEVKRILGNNKVGRFVNDNEGQIGEEYIRIKGRNAPARLIVRDCHLLPESINQLKQLDTSLYMTEWKFENGIDRITAAANPRQVERVPAGSKFRFELVYTVENPEQVEEDLRNIAIALAILEDDALGGHGSRGYGKISFHNFDFFYRSMEQYRRIAGGSGGSLQSSIQQAKNTPELLEKFASLNQQVQNLLPGDNGAS